MKAEKKEDTSKLMNEHENCNSHMDTSQGEFRTIGVAVIIALAVIAVIQAVGIILTGAILGACFIVLVVVFWFIAEKVKIYLENRYKK